MSEGLDDEQARGSVEAKLEELERSILSVNEALFRIVGVLARVIVDAVYCASIRRLSRLTSASLISSCSSRLTTRSSGELLKKRLRR